MFVGEPHPSMMWLLAANNCYCLQDGKDSASQASKGSSGGGLFGGRSRAAADAPTGPQKQKKISAKLVDAKPVGKEVQCCLCLLTQT